MGTLTYLGLHNLVASPGARKRAKRVGRGESSGWGKTAGRGHKGQKSRKSGNVRIGFEGGQNPLSIRLPKRGFRGAGDRKAMQAINLGAVAKRFAKDAVVDVPALVACGLLASGRHHVKVLAQGELSHALKLRVHAISGSAQAKVEAQGGSVELISQRTFEPTQTSRTPEA
ncbi:MAG: 50S ribosomal protein L15 [Myxococcota bacterium]